jgi:hypothetical protein
MKYRRHFRKKRDELCLSLILLFHDIEDTVPHQGQARDDHVGKDPAPTTIATIRTELSIISTPMAVQTSGTSGKCRDVVIPCFYRGYDLRCKGYGFESLCGDS